MKISLGITLLALLPLQVLHAQEKFSLSGKDVAIYNLAGRLEITAGTGNATDVQITRVGADARSLRIANDPIGGVPTLRVIYPGDEIVYRELERGSETNLQVETDGTFGRGRSGHGVRISGGGRAGRDAVEAAADIVVHIPAGTSIHAHVGAGEATIRNVNGNITVDNSSGDITADGVTGSVTLSTASGDIEARSVEGDVDLNSASGSITVEHTRGARLKVNVASGGIIVEDARSTDINVESASGHIGVSDINATTVRLHTASGGIEARSVNAAETSIRTASGSIRAELGGTVKSLEAGTASGSVQLQVPPDISAQLDVTTASGSIDVDLPVIITHQRRGEMHGTIGSGTGRISIATASGAVTIRSR